MQACRGQRGCAPTRLPGPQFYPPSSYPPEAMVGWLHRYLPTGPPPYTISRYPASTSGWNALLQGQEVGRRVVVQRFATFRTLLHGSQQLQLLTPCPHAMRRVPFVAGSCSPHKRPQVLVDWVHFAHHHLIIEDLQSEKKGEQRAGSWAGATGQREHQPGQH